MDDNGDIIGRCAYSACTSRPAYVPMLFTCTLCGCPVFCNQQCYWAGIEDHISTATPGGCVKSRDMHNHMHRKRSGSVVTPRSVTSSAFDLIRLDRATMSTMYARVCREEQRRKTLGILLLSTPSARSLCVSLNYTQHRTDALLSGFLFESCESIARGAALDLLPYTALLPACEMRIGLIEHTDTSGGTNDACTGDDNDDNGGVVGAFVAALYDTQSKRCMIRLFIPHQ